MQDIWCPFLKKKIFICCKFSRDIEQYFKLYNKVTIIQKKGKKKGDRGERGGVRIDVGKGGGGVLVRYRILPG